MMTKLVMINSAGYQYDLLDVYRTPTFQIDGLGFTDDTDFMQIGNRYIPLEEETKQMTIKMDLLFWNDADRRYAMFVRLARRNPLKLMYVNDNNMPLFIPCRLKSITKSDKLRHDKYGCSVSFIATGNPYCEVVELTRVAHGGTGRRKYYGDNGEGYRYDYTYTNELPNRVIVTSNTNVESTCKLTIYGPAQNPVWKHYVNGRQYETGAYAGSIADGRSLVIDSRSMPPTIIEYDGNGNVVADRYAACDFSTERFMHVNDGKNEYLVSHDGTNDVTMKVEAYLEYEAM